MKGKIIHLLPKNNKGFLLLPVLLTVLIVGFGLAGYFVIKKSEVAMAEKKEIQMASQFGAEDMLRRYSYLVNRTNKNNWRIGAIIDGYELVEENAAGTRQLWQRKTRIAAYQYTGAYTMSYFYYKNNDTSTPPIFIHVPDILEVDLSTGIIQVEEEGFDNFPECAGIRIENIPLTNYYGPTSADGSNKASNALFAQIIMEQKPGEEADILIDNVYCSPEPLAFKAEDKEQP